MGLFSFLRKKPAAVPEAKPPSPCGDDETHYYWLSEGWKCPICQGRKERQLERQKEERMAELIAKKMVELMKKGGHDEARTGTISEESRNRTAC